MEETKLDKIKKTFMTFMIILLSLNLIAMTVLVINNLSARKALVTNIANTTYEYLETTFLEEFSSLLGRNNLEVVNMHLKTIRRQYIRDMSNCFGVDVSTEAEKLLESSILEYIQDGDTDESIISDSDPLSFRELYLQRFKIALSSPLREGSMERVTSQFGPRLTPDALRSENVGGIAKEEFHSGTDLLAREGTPVYATHSGYTRLRFGDSGYGNLVEIRNISLNGYRVSTRYAHLKRILVGRGQYVNEGDIIGLVGNTGRSTGVHLHYEVIVNGEHQNPLDYVF